MHVQTTTLVKRCCVDAKLPSYCQCSIYMSYQSCLRSNSLQISTCASQNRIYWLQCSFQTVLPFYVQPAQSFPSALVKS